MWTKLLGRCGAESWPRVCVALFYALSRADFDRGISATTLEKYTKSFVYSSKPHPPGAWSNQVLNGNKGPCV